MSITPPDGESLVDPTTDWEAPDNRFEVALPERGTFVVRLRFAQPLDPRTVNVVSVRLFQTATGVREGPEVPVTNGPHDPSSGLPEGLPVPSTVRLRQTRLGDVVVELVPNARPDPNSRYEVWVGGSLRGLDGEPLDEASTFTFETF